MDFVSVTSVTLEFFKSQYLCGFQILVQLS